MRFGMIAAAAAALVCAGQANAAEWIVQGSVTSGGGSTGFFQGYRFAPTLGTLRSVTVSATLDGDQFINTNVRDAAGNPATARFYYAARSGATLTLGDGTLNIATKATVPYVDVTGQRNVDLKFTGASVAPIVITTGLDYFAGFPGSGTTNSGLLFPQSTFFTNGIAAVAPDGVRADYSISDIGQVISYTLIYTYDPFDSAVPEPATWLMMIGGFGLVGGSLRRRRATFAVAR